jgi:hypothetical protein
MACSTEGKVRLWQLNPINSTCQSIVSCSLSPIIQSMKIENQSHDTLTTNETQVVEVIRVEISYEDATNIENNNDKIGIRAILFSKEAIGGDMQIYYYARGVDGWLRIGDSRHALSDYFCKKTIDGIPSTKSILTKLGQGVLDAEYVVGDSFSAKDALTLSRSFHLGGKSKDMESWISLIGLSHIEVCYFCYLIVIYTSTSLKVIECWTSTSTNVLWNHIYLLPFAFTTHYIGTSSLVIIVWQL